MDKYECKFYVANELKAIKIFEANSYLEAFTKAHEHSYEITKRHFVAINCNKI